MGDPTMEFTFTLSGFNSSITEVEYGKYEGTTPIHQTDNDGYKLTAESDGSGSKKVTFTLKHGQRIELNVPFGSLTLTETAVTGYETWMLEKTSAIVEAEKTDVNKKTVISKNIDSDATIQVLNWMNAVAPTGVNMAYAPFILMLAMGLALPAVLPRRRRKEEE